MVNLDFKVKHETSMGYHGIYGFNGIFDGKYDDDPEVEHRYEKMPIEIDDL
jgi:hypothetical protein